jgi:hypothetical protein
MNQSKYSDKYVFKTTIEIKVENTINNFDYIVTLSKV